MAKAAKSYEGYTADYTTRIQYGETADGRVFRRIQVRDPRYGYKWTRWTETVAAAVADLVNRGPQSWRLPA